MNLLQSRRDVVGREIRTQFHLLKREKRNTVGRSEENHRTEGVAKTTGQNMRTTPAPREVMY